MHMVIRVVSQLCYPLRAVIEIVAKVDAQQSGDDHSLAEANRTRALFFDAGYRGWVKTKPHFAEPLRQLPLAPTLFGPMLAHEPRETILDGLYKVFRDTLHETQLSA